MRRRRPFFISGTLPIAKTGVREPQNLRFWGKVRANPAKNRREKLRVNDQTQWERESTISVHAQPQNFILQAQFFDSTYCNVHIN